MFFLMWFFFLHVPLFGMEVGCYRENLENGSEFYRDFLNLEKQPGSPYYPPQNTKQAKENYLHNICNLADLLFHEGEDDESNDVLGRGIKYDDPRCCLLAAQVAESKESSIELLKKAVVKAQNPQVREKALEQLKFEARTNLKLCEFITGDLLQKNELKEIFNFFKEMMQLARLKSGKVKNIKPIPVPEEIESRLAKRSISLISTENELNDSLPENNGGFVSLPDLYASEAWKMVYQKSLEDGLDVSIKKIFKTLNNTMQQELMRDHYDKALSSCLKKEWIEVANHCIAAESLLKLNINQKALNFLEKVPLIHALKNDANELSLLLAALYIKRACKYGYRFEECETLVDQIEKGIALIKKCSSADESYKSSLFCTAGIFYQQQGLLDEAIKIFEQALNNSKANGTISHSLMHLAQCIIIKQFTQVPDNKEILRAINYWKKLLDTYPNVSILIMRTLHKVDLNLTDAEISEEHIVKALLEQFNKGSLIAASYLKTLGKLPSASKINQKHDKNSSIFHFKSAALCFAQGNYDKAFKELDFVDGLEYKELNYFHGLLFDNKNDISKASKYMLDQLCQFENITIAEYNGVRYFDSSENKLDFYAEELFLANRIIIELEKMACKNPVAACGGASYLLKIYRKNPNSASFKLARHFISKITCSQKKEEEREVINFINSILALDNEKHEDIKWEVIKLLSTNFELYLLADSTLLWDTEKYLNKAKENDSLFVKSTKKQYLYNDFLTMKHEFLKIKRNEWFEKLKLELPFFLKNKVGVESPKDIAECYLGGFTNLKKSVAGQKALKILEFDVLLSSDLACLQKIIELYENGLEGYVKKDFQEALNFVEELAQQGNIAGLLALSKWYRYGYGPIEKNPDLAEKYLFQLYKQESFRSVELATFYYEQQQYDKAIEFFDKSDEIPGYGCLCIANMFRYGQGVEKSMNKFLESLELLCSNGISLNDGRIYDNLKNFIFEPADLFNDPKQRAYANYLLGCLIINGKQSTKDHQNLAILNSYNPYLFLQESAKYEDLANRFDCSLKMAQGYLFDANLNKGISRIDYLLKVIENLNVMLNIIKEMKPIPEEVNVLKARFISFYSEFNPLKICKEEIIIDKTDKTIDSIKRCIFCLQVDSLDEKVEGSLEEFLQKFLKGHIKNDQRRVVGLIVNEKDKTKSNQNLAVVDTDSPYLFLQENSEDENLTKKCDCFLKTAQENLNNANLHKGAEKAEYFLTTISNLNEMLDVIEQITSEDKVKSLMAKFVNFYHEFNPLKTLNEEIKTDKSISIIKQCDLGKQVKFLHEKVEKSLEIFLQNFFQSHVKSGLF